MQAHHSLEIIAERLWLLDDLATSASIEEVLLVKSAASCA
jgi:hypothetical protein